MLQACDGLRKHPSLIQMMRNPNHIFTMMKTIIGLAWILGFAAASPIPKDVILSIDQDNHKHIQRGQPGNAVTGTYQFTAADGALHMVSYIADDNGYRVVGTGKVDNSPKVPVSIGEILPASLTTRRPPPAPTTPPSVYLPPAPTPTPPEIIYLPPAPTPAPPEIIYLPPAPTPAPPEIIYLPPAPTPAPPEIIYLPPAPTPVPPEIVYLPPAPTEPPTSYLPPPDTTY